MVSMVTHLLDYHCYQKKTRSINILTRIFLLWKYMKNKFDLIQHKKWYKQDFHD